MRFRPIAMTFRLAVLRIVLPLALILLPDCGYAGSVAAPTGDIPALPPTFLQMAGDGVATLQSNWYNQQTGLWNTTGWWNAANALTVVAQYSKLSGSNQYLSAVANTYAANSRGGFLNQYYDDEGWWALAWIAAYDWTGSTVYLNTASQIFADMTTGWDTTCGGGIWWSKARTYKNAIANELFLSVAGSLASRVTNATQQASDLSWAQQEWQWSVTFLQTNAQNIWSNDRGVGYQRGLAWSGPFQNQTTANAAIQTSAVDCLLGAAEVASGKLRRLISTGLLVLRGVRRACPAASALAMRAGSACPERAPNTRPPPHRARG